MNRNKKYITFEQYLSLKSGDRIICYDNDEKIRRGTIKGDINSLKMVLLDGDTNSHSIHWPYVSGIQILDEETK